MIGTSTDCHGVSLHAFVSKNGGQMTDLNAFVPPDSGERIEEPRFINASGLIAAQAILPNGDEHAVVLIPCHDDEDWREDEGCRKASPNASTVPNRRFPDSVSAHNENRARLFHHSHITDFGVPKR